MKVFRNLFGKLGTIFSKSRIDEVADDAFYPSENGFHREKYDFGDSIQRENYVRCCLEQLEESSRELEGLSVEYENVTLFLTDMEKIQELNPESREVINNFAKQLMDLEESEKESEQRKSLLTDSEYDHMERISEFMPAALTKLKEAEEYQVLVKRDLQRLDGEKQAFKYRKNELINGQNNMKGMTFICLGAMILLVIILAYLGMSFNFDVSAGIVVAVLVAAASLTLLYVKYNEATREIQKIDRSNNKLILLNNTVKIRYVNNTNLLDYLYMKYDVKSYKSLKKLWDKYIEENNYRLKEEEKKKELEYSKTGLLRSLRRIKVEDPNIWLCQLNALLDEELFKTIRHGLIVQRTKLRKQMEYNAKICQDAQEEVKKIAGQYPSNAANILELLKTYEKAM